MVLKEETHYSAVHRPQLPNSSHAMKPAQVVTKRTEKHKTEVENENSTFMQAQRHARGGT